MDSKPDIHKYCTGGYSPDDIVISGIAGRFPECDNMAELKEALYAKKNLIVFSDARFEKGACEIPYSSYGLIRDLDKLDADFFRVSYPAANALDPASRKLLEVSYESIADSGYDPYDLKGQNIGVYCGILSGDTHQLLLGTPGSDLNNYLRCMVPNRTSFSLDFTGPSFAVDTGCSSAACALAIAYNDIKENRIDGAIVCGCQVDLDPRIHASYIKHGVQVNDKLSIPFDAKTSGIMRTEATVSIFLQKASVARRSYGTLMAVKFISSGLVAEGITVPSLHMQSEMFRGILKELGLKSDDIEFVEAHGTGTPVGDPIELNAIANAYCKDRKKPLFIGSVKSNMGHTEGASAVCSIAKAIIALEEGVFPPQYRYSTPNPACQALVEGKLRVVTQPMKITSPYLPVNSFGFGGTLSQIFMKQNPIKYKETTAAQNPLPRLVLYPATTEEAVKCVLDYVEKTPELKNEFFALLNKLSFTPTDLKPVRGFGLYQKGEGKVVQIKSCSPNKRMVWFIMTGMGCQWPGMGLQLMNIEVFAKSMKAAAAVLKREGLDLFDILKKESTVLEAKRTIKPSFVAITSIQIALFDLLKSLDIQPDGIIGHSAGEVAAAYVDGSCTLEETILAAYWRGNSVDTANTPEGAMAAVGLTWEEAKKRCPDGVYPACHNADDSVTISGLKESVENFVEQLKKENVFARVVNAHGFAFHCECIKKATPILRPALLKVLPNPKLRSSKWITSSHPEEDWVKPSCKFASADYFVNNMESTVRFNEATKRIPSDAVIIEIGPHHLLQAILKRSVGPAASYIGLMRKNEEDSVKFLFESLGNMYNAGLDPKIERLYPPINFPVPRGTPMISDLIRWNYSQSFFVPKWTPQTGESIYDFMLEKKDSYLMDHRIDGRSLFPATGYIVMAWEALASKLQRKFQNVPVVLENFKIHRATIISNQSTIQFSVNLLGSSGSFEIFEGNQLVASGQVHEWKNVLFSEPPPSYKCDDHSSLSGTEVYNELRMAGYEYGPAFQALVEINMEGTGGLVLWQDKWIPFLDALLLFFGMINNTEFSLPTAALHFKIDPTAFKTALEDDPRASIGFPVHYNPKTSTCRTIGVEIKNLVMDPAPRRSIDNPPTLEEYRFVPYDHNYAPEKDLSQPFAHYLYACNKLVDVVGKHLGIPVYDFKFPTAQTNSLNLNDYIERLTDKHQILRLMKNISDNPNSVKKGRRELFSSFLGSTWTDMLICSMVNEYPLRIVLEIISENCFRKPSVLEVNRDLAPVLPTILSIVQKYSYIKFKSSILATAKNAEINKEVLNEHSIQHISHDTLKTFAKENNQDVVISSFMRGTKEDLNDLLSFLSKVVKPNGFVVFFYKGQEMPIEKFLYSLFNEDLQMPSTEYFERGVKQSNLVILNKISDNFGGHLYLLRSSVPAPTYEVMKISDDEDYSWVENVKNFLAKNDSSVLWLAVENNDVSGIVGMMNCLKQEPGGERIRCVLMTKKSKELPPFSFEHSNYKELLEKNLVMNVWKDGRWGSYRHVLMKESIPLKNVEHSYVNCKKYGDLSSFEWLESYVKYADIKDVRPVHIYYSALNFKDVMLASGKLSIGTSKAVLTVGDTQVDDSVLGLEFSGRDASGRKVAGFIKGGGMATSILANPLMCLDVPNKWSLEEAATVPVVYATCYYALCVRARLRKRESILIHSGTGGIGLAAINIALSLQCEIYTTVGNEEKRKYLKEKFPQIKDENIGCSRDVSFEKMIMERTSGKGVNVVLNSLADDKFQASIRCVAKHGRFVEIGKYDLSLDRKIGLKFFLQNITFHAVFLDQLFENTPEAQESLKEIMRLIQCGIENKVVVPLDRTVFSRKEIEEAFRYMAKGVHVGKVLIKIRQEEPEQQILPKILTLPAVPKTYFYASKTYIVIGGLGGFGIEVTKWMLGRGAKNVILTSRYGARTPYHHLCLKRWSKCGYNVQVSTLNVARVEEAEKLLQEASKTGPVGGIINSAVVLKDAFMDCQNARSYEEVCAPKATATKLLSDLSRILCPSLDYFICFSSVSCGRGNAGQTNYGYANSVMERVCEQRRSMGLHGLAIQWGIIGEVGVVHRHMGDDATIAGVSAQSVRSCLEVLDDFCQIKSPVVSSYVNAVATKKTNQTDVLTQISKILGMKDVSEINTTRNFGEMGIDSMVGVEVKQLLENNCDVTLTMQEIFDMKIHDVRSLIDKSKSENSPKRNGPSLVSTTSVKLPPSLHHSEPVIALNKITKGTPIFIVHIGDTDVREFHTLGEVVNQPLYALVWTKGTPQSDVKSMAEWFLKHIQTKTKGSYHLTGYTLSGSLAVEMALQSEKSNRNVKSTTLLDGSEILRRALSTEKDTVNSEVQALCEFVEQFTSETVPQLEDQLLKATSLDQRIGAVLNFMMRSSSEAINKSEVTDALTSFIKKRDVTKSYRPSTKLKKDITLIEDPARVLANDITEVKDLFTQVAEGKVIVHRTFSRSELTNAAAMKQLASLITNVL